jgi:hypothetical protein
MSGIRDTAYPQMKSAPSARELADVYTPNFVELVWAEKRTRESAPRVGLLVLLKTFQRLGYFVSLPEIPRPILAICTHPPEKVKSAYSLIAKTHSMCERMLLCMLYLCCVTGTDPAVLRAEAVAPA